MLSADQIPQLGFVELPLGTIMLLSSSDNSLRCLLCTWGRGADDLCQDRLLPGEEAGPGLGANSSSYEGPEREEAKPLRRRWGWGVG